LGVFEVLLLLLCGLVAGFAAGLFGIGGGVILVPAFWFLFHSFGVPEEVAVKLSVATSLSVIAVTTLFTSGLHLLKGSLRPKELLSLLLYALPGVALGVWVASKVSGIFLKKLFGTLLILLGIRSLTGSKPKVKREKTPALLIPATVFTSGFFSSLFGIGGGVVVNASLFNFSSLPAERVVALASFVSFINALSGTLFYLFVPAQKILPYQVGFVYLPAAVLVSVGSLIGSRLGIFVLRKVKRTYLKRAFGALMIVLGVKSLM